MTDFRRSHHNGETDDTAGPSVRDLAIYQMLCEGRSQTEVAEKFDLTQSRISQIAKEVERWLVPLHLDQVREIKVRHTQCLMYLYSEAMAAWRRSQQDSVSSTDTDKSTTAGQFPGKTNTNSVSRAKNVGSVAFLSEARAALAEIRKIWGADAPIAAEVEDDEEMRFAGMDVKEARQKWCENQIARLQAMMRSGGIN